jgi:hypothetical protein
MVTINFPIIFKFQHCRWKQYSSQHRQADKVRSAPLILLSSGNVIMLCDVMVMKSVIIEIYVYVIHRLHTLPKQSHCERVSLRQLCFLLFYAKLLNTSTFNEINLEASFGSIIILFEVGMNLLIEIIMLNGSCCLSYPTKLMNYLRFIGSSGSLTLTIWFDL